MSGGYTDTKLAEDRYCIWFGGNGYSRAQMAFDFAVLRGAELCQKAGYGYFFSITANNQKGERRTAFVSAGGYLGFVSAGTKPIAEIEIQCRHEAESQTQLTTDTIARIRQAYPKNMS